MKITFPDQSVKIDTPSGIDPIWYEKLKAVETMLNMFSEINPATLTNGQVMVWDATLKKFVAGAN